MELEGRVAERLGIDDSKLVATTPADPEEPHLALWNTATYYALMPNRPSLRRRIDHCDSDGRLIGTLVVGQDPSGMARCTCGFDAPFGGPDLTRTAETVVNIEGLLDHALRKLDEDGLSELEVRAKPAHYGPNESALVFALANRRFHIVSCELNAYIDLCGIENGEDYVARLKPAARKEVRRSKSQGIRTAQVDPGDEQGWAQAYDVLRRNREDRGRPMRLPLVYIQAIRDAFPGRVRLLVTEVEGGIVAAALVYRVAPARDLVQYWGDADHSLPHSPMNPLVQAVVEHALVSGALSVDIGISSEGGVVNQGLIQFKRSVGCALEPRFVFRRTFDGSG